MKVKMRDKARGSLGLESMGSKAEQDIFVKLLPSAYIVYRLIIGHFWKYVGASMFLNVLVRVKLQACNRHTPLGLESAT